jgi:hypothetical protein
MLPARLLFLVPPLAFALQEHLERLVHDGSFPLAAAIEPTFLVGLALQLPFALAAYAVAAALLEVADRVSDLLRAPAAARYTRAFLAFPLPHAVVAPRIGALALGYATRGPPSLGG